MQTLKHTPGPWRVLPEEEGKGYVRIRGTRLGRRFKIANVMLLRAGHIALDARELEETLANAALIAVSPELLEDLLEAAATLRRYEALHRAKGTAESTEKAEVNAALAARFEATIAKATGAAS